MDGIDALKAMMEEEGSPCSNPYGSVCIRMGPYEHLGMSSRPIATEAHEAEEAEQLVDVEMGRLQEEEESSCQIEDLPLRECRICLEPEDAGNPLCTPCDCQGSVRIMPSRYTSWTTTTVCAPLLLDDAEHRSVTLQVRFIHVECLRKWCRERATLK